MDLDEELGILHDTPMEDDRVKIKRYPCLVPDPEYPAHVIDSHTIRVWCELDEDFYATLLSPIRHLVHEVPASMDGMDIDGFLDSYSHYYHPEWRAMRAIQMGLVYRQPFYVELYARYYTSHHAEGIEYDCETSYEILHVKTLSPDEIARRWQEWIERDCGTFRSLNP